MNPVARQTEHAVLILGLCAGSVLSGCGDAAHTHVSMDNDYPASRTSPIVYQGWWQAVPFGCWQAMPCSTPIPPGGSSGPMSTVAASDNSAYVVLAPGWDPSSNAPPTSFIVMQSKTGFAVHLNDTLHIPVDDEHFAGNCLAGSHLTQQQADFITQLVFPATFGAIRYDAATCTATPIGDAAP